MGFLALFSLLLISGVRAGPCTSPADKEVVVSNTTTGAYAWFTGYNDVNLSDVNITKYDALIYSFVYVLLCFFWSVSVLIGLRIPTNDTSKLDVGGSDADIKMHDFVETVTSDGVEAWVSIGGWGGSRYFSPAVATSENRTLFVAAMLNLTETYGFTGIDFECVLPLVWRLVYWLIESSAGNIQARIMGIRVTKGMITTPSIFCHSCKSCDRMIVHPT